MARLTPIIVEPLRSAYKPQYISSRLERDLCRALEIKADARGIVGLPADLAEALDRAVRIYAESGDKDTFLWQREKAEKILRTGQALLRAMAQADVAYGVLPPVESSTLPGLSSRTTRKGLAIAWHEGVKLTLETMVTELTSRLMLENPLPSGRQGNRHARERYLRLGVLREMRLRAKCSLEHNGPAARALLLVLNEAARLDGKPRKNRTGFKASQWSQWLAEYDDVVASLPTYYQPSWK